MIPAARVAPLLALLGIALTAGGLPAQGRPREIDCTFLLLSGCRSYVIEVVRVEPDGTERVQADADTYAVVDPDTLDPGRFLVLQTFDGDRLTGNRAVIWVDRVSGAVGGDWPSRLSNDDVRSAELVGVPGDDVTFHDDRNRRRGGSARLVLFAGRERCRTEVNLDDRGGGCSTVQGGSVAGKVSAITIRYRAVPLEGAVEPPAPGAGAMPAAPPSPDSLPGAPPAAPAPPEGDTPTVPPPPGGPPPAAPAPRSGD